MIVGEAELLPADLILRMNRPILVTGGAGFIGSNFVLQWANHVSAEIVVLDSLTYAANLKNLEPVLSQREFAFVHCEICDREHVRSLLQQHRPRAIVHFAADSHTANYKFQEAK